MFIDDCQCVSKTNTSFLPLRWRMSETATGNKKPRRPDTRQCRICLGGVEEVEELGRLIKPCHCRGSMRVSTTMTILCLYIDIDIYF